MELLRAVLVVVVMVVLLVSRGEAVTFVLRNTCPYNVWPGIQANAGQSMLASGGFLLPAGQTSTLNPPPGWSGRFWGRTDCSFDATGQGNCTTGDCGGKQACNGAGGQPPVTLAEFTLGAKDFYDVSLVDGYNVAIVVAPVGGSGANCSVIGCFSDLIGNGGGCPPPMQVHSATTSSSGGGGTQRVVACRSACAAFGSPEFCCTGAYATPQTCKPSSYSQLFKKACPTAYSYAYDDATSTFTCMGASSYTITFCSTGTA